MLKVSLKYSALCGLFLIGFFLISIKLGSNPLLDLKHLFVDLIIYSVFIYFAAWEYKKYHNGGFLHFWQGMSIALTIYLPAAVIFSVGLLLTFKVDPSLMENYRQEAIALLESQKDFLLETISQEDYDRKTLDVKSITEKDLAVDSGLKKLLIGFFISPVLSILLRRNPK